MTRIDYRTVKSLDPDETWVWDRFKLAWPWRCQRQDPNGGHNSGLPDVHLLNATGQRGLVELKRPSKVVLRPSQWLWHEADQDGGGRSCVVTCDGPKANPLWSVFSIDVDNRVLRLVSHGTDANDMVLRVLKLCSIRR